ncbi:MAG: hypothetical protein PHW32_03265 [Bacilli bacterium]|nr:hypothetical protein [Bacilli bacterium]MDD4283188.1 hypothetical protein [Bacilli bacterium]MDD4718838.1 hypothetical protein [Bacilli bacterium]
MKKELEELTNVQKVSLLSQILITFFILVFLFMSIGEPSLMEVVNILLIILFLVMGFNNHILYKRKKFTLFNIIIALLLFIEKLFL